MEVKVSSLSWGVFWDCHVIFRNVELLLTKWCTMHIIWFVIWHYFEPQPSFWVFAWDCRGPDADKFTTGFPQIFWMSSTTWLPALIDNFWQFRTSPENPCLFLVVPYKFWKFLTFYFIIWQTCFWQFCTILDNFDSFWHFFVAN